MDASDKERSGQERCDKERSGQEKILSVALTGTPGTGKTTVSRLLEKRGHHVLFLTEFIKENNISSERDEERDCLVVDMDALEDAVSDHIISLEKSIPAGNGNEGKACQEQTVSEKDSVLIIESHMAHYLCDYAIVFRTHPSVLEKRLSERGYSPEKVRENAMAEALDIILCEAYDWCGSVLEVDNTERDPEDSADAVEEILSALLRLREKGLLPETSPADGADDCESAGRDGGNVVSVPDEGAEIYTDDNDACASGHETILEKDETLRKYLPGSIDWSSLAD
ncbi:MAG: adenylate kinase family protein [Methanosarcinaceae archaeon]|nr:adenylate kinase family protein [Methanosarcinaceae archaeon]